jgi:hypothetical protein
MNDRDFEVGSFKFKLSKINAMAQFHVVRRISHLIPILIPVFEKAQKIQGKEGLSETEKFSQIAAEAKPFLEGLSAMSDQESEKVLFSLLSSVETNRNGGWAKVANDKMLFFQDFELPVLLQCAGRAFMYNLTSFFPGPPKP